MTTIPGDDNWRPAWRRAWSTLRWDGLHAVEIRHGATSDEVAAVMAELPVSSYLHALTRGDDVTIVFQPVPAGAPAPAAPLGGPSAPVLDAVTR
jgi:hypothetical protein